MGQDIAALARALMMAQQTFRITPYIRTSENSVWAKFRLPHSPGPEGLTSEGTKYGEVLLVSYVCQAMNPQHST